MTEEIETNIETEEIEPFQDVEDKTLEDEEDVLNLLKKDVPVVADTNVYKGVGGKYLDQATSTSNFETSSTDFVDVTNLSITKDISNRRVLLLFSGGVWGVADDRIVYLTFEIDGDTQGNLVYVQTQWDTSQTTCIPVHMIFVTGLLVGTHTFKVQAKVSSGTGYVRGDLAKSVFSAIELSD